MREEKEEEEFSQSAIGKRMQQRKWGVKDEKNK